MKEVTVSEFRAHLHAIVKQVQKTKRPIRITRLGRPIVEVRPAAPLAARHLMGFMKGKMDIVEDIISPANDPDDWEVLRD